MTPKPPTWGRPGPELVNQSLRYTVATYGKMTSGILDTTLNVKSQQA